MDPKRASTQAANLDNLDASYARTSKILDQWFWSNRTVKKWESFIDDNVIRLLAISYHIMHDQIAKEHQFLEIM